MATQSASPPNPKTEKPEALASEPVQSTNEDGQNAKAPATISPPSVFVNSEPMREEQVQNAVKFLSHPRVRGSPIIQRRSFLEKKGLTKEEIDEAFRRVPDPPPTVGVQAASTNHDQQLKSSHTQQQALAQSLHPSAPPQAGVISQRGNMTGHHFHWSYAFLAVGFLAAAGAGTAILFKKTIIPRLKSWIRKIVMEEENGKPSLVEETAAAAKAAAAATADVAKIGHEILHSKNEEKRHFEELVNVLGLQIQEMKSMSDVVRKLEAQNNATSRIGQFEQEDTIGIVSTSSKQLNVNGKDNFDMRSVRPSLQPASAEPSVAPHSKSFGEIMAMVHRGEKPSNIREINDQPPNPNQPLTNPRMAPRPKPWEVGQSQYSNVYQLPQYSNVYQSQVNEGLNSRAQDNGVSYQLNGDSSTWWQQKNAKITESEAEDVSKTAAYNERPVQRAWVPPPMPPIAMPEAAAAIRQPKSSIKRGQQESIIKTEQLANDEPVSRSSDETDELQRITKISESGGAKEINSGNLGMNASEIQRAWVRPPMPPISMPEAVAAIRQPKSPIQRGQQESINKTEQLAIDESVSRPLDATDELQRITAIPESGGAMEINGWNSGLNSSEIQRAWVPPPTLPIAMPEAAAAIRQPKSSIQIGQQESTIKTEQLANDESVSRPLDETDEVQRITRISEPEVAMERNGGNSGLNSSEIQQEQE